MAIAGNGGIAFWTSTHSTAANPIKFPRAKNGGGRLVVRYFLAAPFTAFAKTCGSAAACERC